jgi:hypothetical protein
VLGSLCSRDCSRCVVELLAGLQDWQKTTAWTSKVAEADLIRSSLESMGSHACKSEQPKFITSLLQLFVHDHILLPPLNQQKATVLYDKHQWMSHMHAPQKVIEHA